MGTSLAENLVLRTPDNMPELDNEGLLVV